MQVTRVRHDWPEKAGFTISRPTGLSQYTFLHFANPICIRLNGELIHTRPGACIFFAPGIPQWFHSEQDLIHNWLHTDESLHPLLEAYGIPQNQLLYPSDTGFISELFSKLEIEHFSDNPFRQPLMEGIVNEFVIRLARSLSSSSNGLPRKDRQAMQAVRFRVLSAPEHNWTVSEMAALTSLSASRFHAVYKAQFGTSPMQDVIASKIGYAKSLLLLEEKLTLMEVAEKLGYNDQYHFIRQFKAVTGQTPGSYRKARK